MKTICPPGYHQNGFVATHALGHMSCHKAIVVITGRAHCFHDYIYIYLHIYINIYQINLRTVAVSPFESSSAQLRSSDDFEGPECSKYYKSIINKSTVNLLQIYYKQISTFILLMYY